MGAGLDLFGRRKDGEFAAEISLSPIHTPEINTPATRALANLESLAASSSPLSLPDVSGMDLYSWLQEKRPELAKRTIFMTGGAYTRLARDFLDSVDNPRIDKPFTLAAITALVRGVEVG